MMTKNDQAALELAMQTVMRTREAQLVSMLLKRPWQEVAEFASFCAQGDTLDLRPWETPPCLVDGGDWEQRTGPLLKRMLRAGISRWHPDPIKALREAEASK
jgi:hypothetical protein